MYKLEYTKIPEIWSNGLPIGNGRLAAMYWGNATTDIFSLNHEYLWREKYKGKVADKSYDKLPLLRELLKKGDYFRATLFANLFLGGMGGDSGVVRGRIDSYQPAGNLCFEYDDETKDGVCKLDIVSGTGCVNRNRNVEVGFFADSNDGNIMIEWSAQKPFCGRLYFDRETDEEATYSTRYTDTEINFECKFVCGASYTVKVIYKTDGMLQLSDEGVNIADAQYLVCNVNVILTLADNKNNSLEFKEMLVRHTNKFSSYMNRIKFEINSENIELPTNERIKQLRDGAEDNKLTELYFHFGRYLMISSCICGVLPPNLQGKWNLEIRPPWSSDYHLNINLQMNEWLIESCDLSEFAEPLTDFLLNCIEGGRKSAKNLYGCRGIWLPISTDVWCDCTPESFGFTVWVGAAAWMAQPLWEHYLYTGDKEYLKNKAYKYFKEVALFYEDFLVEDENGIMQIMPSQSPENRFIGTGKYISVSICTSSSVDVQLAYDGLGYAINSAKILGVDSELAEKWEKIREKLPAFKVGSDGRLMEWNEEFEEEQPGHRHLSHLYGLYPSKIFTPKSRIKEYEGAIKSLDFRLASDSGYTGWSRAWISNLYARIGRKNDFYHQINGLLKDFATDSLLDTHPFVARPGTGPFVFQIDGNFGMVSAVAEAVFSYFDNVVHVLHAVPEQWSSGAMKGVKLPGGHTISVEWKNGIVTDLTLVMGYEEKVIIEANGKEYNIEGSIGQNIIINL